MEPETESTVESKGKEMGVRYEYVTRLSFLFKNLARKSEHEGLLRRRRSLIWWSQVINI